MLKTRIKELRGKNKISQDKLGKLLNLSQQAIAKWEKGKSEPDAENINNLAKIFDCSVEYLLGNTNDPTPINIKKERPSQKEQDALEVFDHLVGMGIFNLDEDLDSQIDTLIKFVNSNKDFILALKDKNK